VDNADCCLIGIVSGVTEKISDNNNIIQYLEYPVPNNPMPVAQYGSNPSDGRGG